MTLNESLKAKLGSKRSLSPWYEDIMVGDLVPEYYQDARGDILDAIISAWEEDNLDPMGVFLEDVCRCLANLISEGSYWRPVARADLINYSPEQIGRAVYEYGDISPTYTSNILAIRYGDKDVAGKYVTSDGVTYWDLDKFDTDEEWRLWAVNFGLAFADILEEEGVIL